jgi:hypothetical protein
MSTIGPGGGQVSAAGVELDIPPGALPTATSIAISIDPNGVPSGYIALSPLLHFSPDGLTFAKPATVTFGATGSPPGAHVYWSRSSGPGYDELPTTWLGMTASATVSHFSSGFVGTPTEDGGSSDATSTDGGETPDQDAAEDATILQDATEQEASLPEGAAPGDGATAMDASLDAGTTFVSGLVQGATPAGGSTVTVVVDEWSSEPDADAGCTATAQTGHQETTVPAYALPYLFRFYFGDPPTSSCDARTYDVSVSDMDSAGNVLASGSASCAGAFGAPVSCGVSLVLSPTDASTVAADAASDAGVDAGNLLNSTIQFTGTVTGTMPPGASYLYIALKASTDPLGTMNNQPFCSPTVPNFQGAGSVLVAPTLPAAFSFSYGPNASICGAAFEIETYPMTGAYAPLPGSSPGTAQCGYIGTGNTGGTMPIESTSVTCDVVLP